MDENTKKVEYQVLFWSLLGPFFLLLSISVLLFKLSPHWYLPFAALAGIPLCIWWKTKGIASAIVILFIASAIVYRDLPLYERYWYVGLSLAIAFSFVIFLLSLEEAESLLAKTKLESQSRLDNFIFVDAQWKEAEKQWKSEKENLLVELTASTDKLEKKEKEKQTFYHFSIAARDELTAVQGKQELLRQDLLSKTQNIERIQEEKQRIIQERDDYVLTLQKAQQDSKNHAEKIERIQEEKQRIIQERDDYVLTLQKAQQDAKNHAEKIERIQEEKQRIIQERDDYVLTLQKAQQDSKNHAEKIERIQEEKQRIIQERDDYVLTLQKAQQDAKNHAEKIERIQEEKQRIIQERDDYVLTLQKAQQDSKNHAEKIERIQEEKQRIIQERDDYALTLQKAQQDAKNHAEKIERIQEEKQRIIQERDQCLLACKAQQDESKKNGSFPSENDRKIEAMYMQLKNQFQEKCNVLDAVRRELFLANEKILASEREAEEKSLTGVEEERKFEQFCIAMGHHYENMQKISTTENQELGELISKLMEELTNAER